MCKLICPFFNSSSTKKFSEKRDDNFALNGLMGFDINGCTVGVIGTGSIGACFARIMKCGFQCRVLAYDIVENEECKAIGVEYVSLDKLLQESKIISLHCPLVKATHHIIDDKAFDKMQEKPMLINTSRGGLLDTDAAIKGDE